MLKIPDYFFEVPYKASHHPLSEKTNGLEGGANCQVFAYEVLRHFGLKIPNFRSSELWEDSIFTQKINNLEELEPLDILLWNKTDKVWGSHVGVYLGNKSAIHLSKENSYPKIT